MAFVSKKHTSNAKINEVTIGTGDKAVTIGGGSTLPFYTFDAETANAPKIGMEVTDLGMAAYPQSGLQEFYAGCATVADMAERAQSMAHVSFIALHLEGADPNGANRSVDECVALCKEVAERIALPLVVLGC